MRTRSFVAALAAVGAVGALAIAALTGGSDRPRSAAPTLLDAEDPGLVHVHGLGVDPADGALFIATHTGLYRVPADAQKADRVGESRQDTMGFTVVGPNRFLGSGHPDPQAMREQGLPPHLGLIESADAGRTWRSVSLLGEADFHVLRSRGRYVYGFDSTRGRLLVSDDRGATWVERASPGALYDLAVDPADPERVVAAGEPGLYASADGGRAWSRLGDRVGLLAWPAGRSVYLVDGGGRVWASSDGGRRWTGVGEVGGEPAAFAAHGARELYAAIHDGTVRRSLDGGRTWTVRSTP